MNTQEIITCISCLILIGLAITLYLIKNAPLDPDDKHLYDSYIDLPPIPSFPNVVIPILVVVAMVAVIVGIYNNPIW